MIHSSRSSPDFTLFPEIDYHDNLALFHYVGVLDFKTKCTVNMKIVCLKLNSILGDIVC